MRGIAGIIRFDRSSVARAEIDRVMGAMTIFPSDRSSTWNENEAALAYCAKFTVPEDRFESELSLDRQGRFVLVSDAVLTNRDELSAAFGWRPDEAARLADSAFVQAAYAKWGEAAPAKLDGQFAFAAWHPRERRLFAAVDALGFRPIYHWHRGGVFAFATTLRGLFGLPEVSRELNTTVFAEGFLGLDQVTDETLYRDVRRVLRGHSVTVEGGEVRAARYWWPSATPELRLRSDEDYVEAFRAEFRRAVGTSLRAKGNVGLLLSGGLDSSAVGAMADQILAEQGRRLQAFHLVPPGAERHHAELVELNESSYVRDLQGALPHTDFHFHRSTLQPLLNAEELAQHFEDEQIPSHMIFMLPDPGLKALLAREQIGTMLNGYGGNSLVSLELRGNGYLDYLAASGRWLALYREIQGHHRIYGASRRGMLREAFASTGLFPAAPPRESLRLRLLHPDHPAGRFAAERLRAARTPSTPREARDLRGKWLRFLADHLAQHTGVSASAISRHAMVARSAAPMFDRRLNEFCLRLPPRQQFRDGEDRRILREAMRGLLPDRVRLRRTRGFPVPLFQSAFAFHRNALLVSMERLIAEPVNATWFNRSFVEELLTRLRQPNSNSREENAATSFVGWASFLAWRTNRPSLSRD